ncbi:hypothetical protein PputUW4_05084 [Pseudomonas sp. UW4]|nr:hypothetical protein PputUW4_05084 [Pseudomonas sp. UW4]
MGASLLAMGSRTPRVPSGSASPLTTIASKLAPTMSDGTTFNDPEPLMAPVGFLFHANL